MKKRSKKSFASFLGKAFAGGAVFGIAFALVIGMVVHAQDDDGAAVNADAGNDVMVMAADAQPLIYRVFSTIAGEEIGGDDGALSVDINGNIGFSPTGAQLVVDQGGSLELGAQNGTAGAGSPYIDFHSADNTGNSNDYNVRLINDSAQPDTLKVDGSLDVTGTFNSSNAAFSGNVTGLGWDSTVPIPDLGNDSSQNVTCPADTFMVGFNFIPCRGAECTGNETKFLSVQCAKIQ